MVESARRLVLSSILLTAVSIAGKGAYADIQDGRLVPWRIERDIQRFRTVATDHVMELLAIRPGMTILDIGAGTGQFAYEFARRLDGTGRVYATDTNEYCIDYMREEAARRGLPNLHPVLVKRDGVDDFYGRHKYDLITVFHIAMAYEDRVDYLRELRGLLAEDGRLVLILYKIPTPFSPDDFTANFRGFSRDLSLEPAGSPFFGLLKASTRRLIRDHPEALPPGDVLKAIVDDFNEALSDTRFPAQFSSGSVFRKELRFYPEEKPYADWLLLSFPDSRVPRRDIKIQSDSGTRTFATINKLLIMQRYREFLKKDGLFRSGFTAPIEAAFEKAGYRLERVYPDLVPFEDIIVFSGHRARRPPAP